MGIVKALTILVKSGATQLDGILAVATWSSHRGIQAIPGVMTLAAEEDLPQTAS